MTGAEHDVTGVEIVEVGPRDGLQNEPGQIPTADKIALIDALSGAGFGRIEVASFVSPKWVPQMADGAAVLAGIRRAPGVRYGALVPNARGLAAAVAAGSAAGGLDVAVFASASEGFSRANINASVAQSLARYGPLVDQARGAGLRVRGYVSCVIDCPFDGPTPPEAVAAVAESLWRMGCFEISLGDTLGRGRPEAVRAMLAAVSDRVPVAALAGHFHDTGGGALANIDASLAAGVRVFDASIGGLGGCPYAPGAPGNVATERVAAHLAARGVQTGLRAEILEQAAALARRMRGAHV